MEKLQQKNLKDPYKRENTYETRTFTNNEFYGVNY